MDSAVIAWLEEVFEANVNTAEEKLQMIVDKSVGFTYATAVLFPETFIHQQEASGYSREEAEALFLSLVSTSIGVGPKNPSSSKRD